MPDIADLVEFAGNTEPRCACVLLLDTSGSMDGDRIDALNEGVKVLEQSLKSDSLASRRVELAVVAFDSTVRIEQDFLTAAQFQAKALTAGGSTSTFSAICQALDMLEARKATYKAAGISYYRPWLFLITDGEPTESGSIETDAIRRLSEAQEQRRVAFFAVGVEDANMERLAQLGGPSRSPMKLKGLHFPELFVWLSRSMSQVSKSKVDDKQIALPPVVGWNAV